MFTSLKNLILIIPIFMILILMIILKANGVHWNSLLTPPPDWLVLPKLNIRYVRSVADERKVSEV